MSVTFTGVSKAFGSKAVLRDFTHVFAPGVHLLLGANGSGKSTLLNLVAGLFAPDGGRIEIDGQPVDAAKGRSFLVPAEIPNMPWLRAGELIDFAASLYDFHRGPQMRAQLVERLGIGPFRGKRLAELSSGTGRKAVITAALLAAPPVLLFDEPTNELDEASAREFVELLRELPGRVVIVATHQPERFASLATSKITIATPSR